MNMIQFVGRVSLAASAILWLSWQSSARRRLRELGERPLSYPGVWSVVVWFVPLLNFVAPYTLTEEMVHRSARDHGTAWDPMERPSHRPRELVLWWGAWCGWFVIILVTGMIRTPIGEELWTLARVVASGMGLVAAYYGSRIVSRVERNLA